MIAALAKIIGTLLT